MIINFQGIQVSVPNPSTNGAKEFVIPDGLWDVWKKNKGLCKAHGFFIEQRNNEWVGIYRPFARFAEGTKRVREEQSEIDQSKKMDLYVPEIFDIGF